MGPLRFPKGSSRNLSHPREKLKVGGVGVDCVMNPKIVCVGG